jgi:hypothetical protein
MRVPSRVDVVTAWNNQRMAAAVPPDFGDWPLLVGRVRANKAVGLSMMMRRRLEGVQLP